jgi:hypothetical protein
MFILRYWFIKKGRGLVAAPFASAIAVALSYMMLLEKPK